MVNPSARAFRALSIVALTVVLWAATPFANLYGSSRPAPIEPPVEVSRYPAAPAFADALSAPMVHRASGLPIRLPGAAPELVFHVERMVVERYGIEPVLAAAEAWSTIPGSRLRVRIAGVVDDGVERNVFDGTNRIFINNRTCVRPELAKVHVNARDVDDRFGTRVIHLREANIGLCPYLRAELVEKVLAHEIGHAVGFGHLCDATDRHDCARPAEVESMRCRVMYSAAAECQTWDERDDRAVVRLYPLAPRLAGPDLTTTAARTAHALVPDAWRERTVVVLDETVDEPVRWAAVAAAGALRAPLLVAPPDRSGCLDGEFARELSRISAFGGEVLLVGPAATACAAEMERWQLDTSRAHDVETLTDAVRDRVRTPRTTVVVGVAPDGTVPFGSVAAALAGQIRSPLVFATEGSVGDAGAELLEELRTRRAILVGSRVSVPVRLAAELRAKGIDSERILASSTATASVQLAGHRAFERTARVLVTSSRGDDALVASAWAPVVDAVPLLVDEDGVHDGVEELLGERGQGYVVGSGVSERVAHRMNVWMDQTDR